MFTKVCKVACIFQMVKNFQFQLKDWNSQPYHKTTLKKEKSLFVIFPWFGTSLGMTSSEWNGILYLFNMFTPLVSQWPKPTRNNFDFSSYSSNIFGRRKCICTGRFPYWIFRDKVSSQPVTWTCDCIKEGRTCVEWRRRPTCSNRQNIWKFHESRSWFLKWRRTTNTIQFRWRGKGVRTALYSSNARCPYDWQKTQTRRTITFVGLLER